MSPEAQRIAIAEACGYKNLRWETFIGCRYLCDDATQFDFQYEQAVDEVPDYLSDLNAMHEAEKVMPNGMWTRYVQWLAELAGGTARFVVAHAAAAQRAEAFLRTLGKWTE